MTYRSQYIINVSDIVDDILIHFSDYKITLIFKRTHNMQQIGPFTRPKQKFNLR